LREAREPIPRYLDALGLPRCVCVIRAHASLLLSASLANPSVGGPLIMVQQLLEPVLAVVSAPSLLSSSARDANCLSPIVRTPASEETKKGPAWDPRFSVLQPERVLRIPIAARPVGVCNSAVGVSCGGLARGRTRLDQGPVTWPSGFVTLVKPSSLPFGLTVWQ